MPSYSGSNTRTTKPNVPETHVSSATPTRDTARDYETLRDPARHCEALRDTARLYETLRDPARNCETLRDPQASYISGCEQHVPVR
jgi:hypothetical protein